MSALPESSTAPFVFPCNDPKCPHLDPTYEAPARPYSHKHKGPKSVTSLIGTLDKGDGMQHAAARLTVETCWHAGAEMRAMDLDEAVNTYARVFKGVWDKRALLGNLTHEAIDYWSRGETYEVPAVFRDKPVDLDARDLDQLGVFLDGAYAWCVAREPEVLASELIVAREDPAIIGSLDRLQVVTLPEVGRVVAVTDWKTTIHVDHDPYEREWELQLKMYGCCDRIQHWHDRTLVSELPWAESGLPRPTHGLLVNIQGDGSVREFVCELSDDVLTTVSALVELKAWKPTLRQVSTLNKPPEPELIAYEPRPEAPVSVAAYLD